MAVGARVTVTGIVTAEPGRLGTPALIAIGDDVRGHRGPPPERRGRLRARHGPAGQRDARRAVRPARDPGRRRWRPCDRVRAHADRPPRCRPMGSTRRWKDGSSRPPGRCPRSRSGHPVAISRSPWIALARRRSSCWPTPPASSSAEAFKVGATYRVVGVVGQRATKKGALDGYRVCLRDPADVIATARHRRIRARDHEPVAGCAGQRRRIDRERGDPRLPTRSAAWTNRSPSTRS